MKDDVFKYLKSFQIDFNHFIKKSNKDIMIVAKVISEAFTKNNKLLICGNGGSASDAQHFSAELVGRFKKERVSLPAIALNTDTSSITAIANDYDYKRVFSRQIEGLGQKGDILLAISTSGNSKNIINGVIKAKENGSFVIGLTGKTGGKLEAVVDLLLNVPSNDTARIQEGHRIIIHSLCQLVEKNM